MPGLAILLTSGLALGVVEPGDQRCPRRG